MHYVSVCPSCIVSRIALADVSGHGRAVVSLSDKLRELMQKYLTALEQASLMRDLNEAVWRNSTGSTTPRWWPSAFTRAEGCS